MRCDSVAVGYPERVILHQGRRTVGCQVRFDFCIRDGGSESGYVDENGELFIL